MDNYYFAPTESRLRMSTGPYSLRELKEIASKLRGPLKFFDEHGMLKGTVYPDGSVQW